MRVLIIIPAFNEEKNLPGLLAELKTSCPEYDVVVINDCSRDGTARVCADFGVTAVNLPVNLGIGGAVQTGYKYAYYNGYDVAIQVDGDGQHNPAYITRLVEGIRRGSNLCIGSRFIEMEGFQSSITRRVGIKFFCKLIYFITGKSVTDPTSGFRACDRKVIRFFSGDYPKDYPEPETIVSVNKKDFKVSEIPVVMKERVGGKSSITALKSVYYMFKVSLAIIIAAFARSEH